MTNIQIPKAPAPIGAYEACVIRNGMGAVSGQFPIQDGNLLYPGQVGQDISIDEAKVAIEIATLNVLAQVKQATNNFANLEGLVRLDGYIASCNGFYQQAEVIDVASELLLKVLGDKGKHARTAFSVLQLPLNASVELVVTFAVKP